MHRSEHMCVRNSQRNAGMAWGEEKLVEPRTHYGSVKERKSEANQVPLVTDRYPPRPRQRWLLIYGRHLGECQGE